MKKIIAFQLIIVLSLFFGCDELFESENNNPPSNTGTVKYLVVCSPSGFDITYENSSGNTEQQDISSANWSTTFTGTKGNFVYISAQADNEDATITVQIFYKGALIEEATSSGDYVIATASGSLP